MTTVAFRGGIIAADTRNTIGYGQIVPGEWRKVWRMTNRTLVGVAGMTAEILGAILNAKCREQIRALNSHSGSMIMCVEPGGRIWLQQAAGAWADLGRPEFHAIGTGAPAAIGAMAGGASARAAVRSAMHADVFTGGPIQALTFEGPELMPPPFGVISGAPKLNLRYDP